MPFNEYGRWVEAPLYDLSLAEFREIMFSIEAGLDKSLHVMRVVFPSVSADVVAIDKQPGFDNWLDIVYIPKRPYFVIEVTGYITPLGKVRSCWRWFKIGSDIDGDEIFKQFNIYLNHVPEFPAKPEIERSPEL